MQKEHLYLLIEALINLNIRSLEDAYSFKIYTILFYFFLVTSTSYMINIMNLVVRFFATSTAFVFNFAFTHNLHIQLAVDNNLLNVLGKLAFEDKARIFKDNLIAKGI